MWIYLSIISVVAYPIIGRFLWLYLECKEYEDGYTRWRTGSGKVYMFFWPIMLIKLAIEAFKLLWHL